MHTHTHMRRRLHAAATSLETLTRRQNRLWCDQPPPLNPEHQPTGSRRGAPTAAISKAAISRHRIGTRSTESESRSKRLFLSEDPDSTPRSAVDRFVLALLAPSYLGAR